MDQQQIQNLSPQQREELMRNVQAQVALSNMQELLTVSSENTTKYQFLKLIFLAENNR